MAQPTTSLVLTPVLPKGRSVVFGMVGKGTFGAASGGSSGGIQIVDRPRRKAITQWYDASPMSLELTLILDGGFGPTPASVEPQCSTVFGWQYPPPGRMEPPVLSIQGPVDANARRLYWWVYKLQFDQDKVIRDPVTGERTQQNLSLTLIEYSPSTASVLTHQSPAQIAQTTLAAQGYSASRNTYVVRSGDTLAKVAARQLGDYTKWRQIADLNGIRDPRSAVALTPGRKLVLPF